MEKISLSIIMPALNEEKNIAAAIDETLDAFKSYNVTGEVVVINDGSRDSTPLIVKEKAQANPGKIKLVEHLKPRGMGASFWDGVTQASGNTVCMLPGDNENIPGEIIRYLPLLNDVDIVVPFVFNKTARSFFRNVLSGLYRFIINSSFGTSLNYTNGTVIYRKSLLLNLPSRSGGFFFQTDILIRLIKQGYLFAEVPYRLRGRKAGKAKAVSFRSFRAVVKGYLRLLTDIYFRKNTHSKQFAPDSVSFKRFAELCQ